MNTKRFFIYQAALLISAILLSLNTGFAQQAVITGKVTDKTNNEPVPFANVYFNNSLTGTTTNAKGNYLLKNLEPGVYVFIVSFVGYESFHKSVRLAANDTLNIDVRLVPSLVQLSEVEVKGKVDPKWKRDLRRFESNFFGPDVTSKDCEILNPESLVFHDFTKADSFTVDSRVPIQFINHRLGYKVYFTLKQFLVYKGNLSIYYGDVRFERLPAETSGQLSAWEMNRYNAYRGSLRNFFHDMIDNTLVKDGFKANMVKPSISYMPSNHYSDRERNALMPLDRKSMILFSGNPNSYFIISNLPIEIVYTGRFWSKSPYPDMPFEVSDLMLKNGRIEVNKNGFVYDPTAFTVSGNRSWERAADMLPFEYKPPGSEGSGTTANLDDIYFHLLDSLSSAIGGKGKLGNQEDVIITTDKPYYISGDDLWYSARLVNGFSRQPEAGDRIVYVELLSPNDSVIASQTVPCLDGLSSGRIVLPDYLPDGCYLLRGYTDWMRNFSDAGYMGKSIMIHSGINNPFSGNTVFPGKDSANISFYPEGGAMLDGETGLVAFRATGTDGKGLLLKGMLVDDRGKEIIGVKSNAMGIGEINFEPDVNRKYYLKVNDINMRLKDLRFPLPAVQGSGYAMTVIDREPNTFTVDVKATKDLKDHGLALIVQAGGQVFYRQALFLEGTEKKLTLYKSLFPQGVVQLNLFDLEGNYIAQRLIYNRYAGDDPMVSVKTSKPEYDPDESVKMHINISDQAREPLSAWLSVSVTANDIFDPSAFRNPAPEVMLQSEFYQGIQDPGYYFRDTTAETSGELDNLLLTLTQYRYDWKRLHKAHDFEYGKTGSLPVSGVVTVNKKYCAGCSVNLYPVTSGLNYAAFTTDDDGRFNSSVTGLFDTAKYVTQITDRKGKVVEGNITLDDRTRFDYENPYRECPLNVKSKDVEDYDSVLTLVKKEEEYMNTILLKEVSITKKAIVNPNENDKPKLSGLYSQPDNVIDLRKSGDQYTTVAQALMQNLTGFLISYDPVWGNHRFILHGINSMAVDSMAQDPLFIVDGMQLDESTAYSQINSINPSDIDHIEVYKDASAAFWGSRGANGVIAIFTKAYMGTEDARKVRKRSVLAINGFSPEETFKPLEQDSTDIIKPDKRITVYWSGHLHTDAAGNVNLDFVNASNASYFTVHVEGITSNGVPFSYVERTNH